jgi:TolB protein
LHTLDIDTGELTQILDTAQPHVLHPLWLSNNTILFDYGSRGSDILTIRPDGTDETYLTSGSQPLWSPDGAHIAYLSRASISPIVLAGTGAVWVMNSDGSDSRSLTNYRWSDGIACWPSLRWEDSDTIVYVDTFSTRYLASLDGTVTTDQTCESSGYPDTSPPGPSLSPDGQWITFPAIVDGYSWICVYPVGNPEASVLITWGTAPAWSPDGQRILFSR